MNSESEVFGVRRLERSIARVVHLLIVVGLAGSGCLASRFHMLLEFDAARDPLSGATKATVHCALIGTGRFGVRPVRRCVIDPEILHEIERTYGRESAICSSGKYPFHDTLSPRTCECLTPGEAYERIMMGRQDVPAERRACELLQ
jgi:hypothetical protein